MTMVGNFSFKGKWAYEDFGLICRTISRPLLPALKKTVVDFPHISGSLIKDSGAYENRTIKMEIQYLTDDFQELRDKAAQLAEWLGGGGIHNLDFPDMPGKHYRASLSAETDLETIMTYGKATLIFECLPFAVWYHGYTTHTVNSELVLAHTHYAQLPTNAWSQVGTFLIFEITGYYKNPTITVNGKRISILYENQGADNTLILDGVEMTATVNGFSIYDKLSGDLQDWWTINPGTNDIKITSEDPNPMYCSIKISQLFY